MYQYHASVENSRRLMEEQAETLAALIETEVANVAQFGPYRQERLESMFRRLVDIGAVSHLRLVDGAGHARVEAGGPLGTDETGIMITRRLVIREPFDVAHGTSAFPVSGPGGNPSGLLTGPATLVLRFSDERFEQVRHGAVLLLAVSLVLVAAFGASAGLWLRAARRSAETERQLRLAQERSKHLEGLNLMASGLAHEIRNPIGAVHGFAQLLAERFPDASPEGRYAQVMLESLDEVSERVTRLLSFARPREPERKPADLDELVRNVARLITPDLESKQVSLTPWYTTGEHPARVDVARIKEVVLNLLLNALDAVEPGGVIRVGTSFDAAARAHVIEVSDDGKGIAPEHIDQVFTPYFTTKSKGSGLGLAICRRVVEDHGGTITIESEPGVGTTVIAVFPEMNGP